MAEPKSFVALNLGSQRISIAVFQTDAGGGLVLLDYRMTELLGDPAADASRIAQMNVAIGEMVKASGVARSSVRYAVSGQNVFSRFVKLPPLTEEKVDQIVEFEAQQNVPFPINDVVWDYQLVSAGGADDVEVVLIAIKADLLDEINQTVESSRLKTRTVDVAPMALYNAFRYNYSDLDEPCLLLDIGARTTNLIYIEGSRLFTRSVPVGGATITGAIAKELEIPFPKAEQRKLEDGFVALGGAYADDPDPAKATMSKVIRHTLNRLHAEIGRTNNYYRAQQKGSAPARVFLCGGSCVLPYMREFFSEKLRIPIDFCNPLRNVTVGAKVDPQQAGADAHVLGEVVGLGLREMSNCPMEIDLVPESVQTAREIDARKPTFFMAGACLIALFLAGFVFFNRAASGTDDKTTGLAAESNRMRRYEEGPKGLDALDREVAAVRRETQPLLDAVKARAYWVELLRDINSRLPGDALWLTEFSLYSNGNPIVGRGLFGGKSSSSASRPNLSEKGSGKSDMIDEIRLSGLYRQNPRGSKVVWDFVKNLKESDYFGMENVPDDRLVPMLDESQSSDRHAWPFRVSLNLKGKVSLK